MKKLGSLAFAVLMVVSVNLKDAFAHVRTYAWNQEYQTIPQGTFEFEDWTTFSVPDGSQTRENSIQYQGELEYGITDHWTFSNYERWKTINVAGPDDSTVYEGFKFENKYRFGERGKYWLDPLLYLEWKTDPREHDHHNELEGKMVLSKSFGKFNAVYNHILEFELAGDGRMHHEFTSGANYQVFSDLRAGVEFTGQYWNPGSHRNELALGPTLSWESKYFWVVAGVLFGANHEASDHEIRLIVGIPLPFDTGSFLKRTSTEKAATA